VKKLVQAALLTATLSVSSLGIQPEANAQTRSPKNVAVYISKVAQYVFAHWGDEPASILKERARKGCENEIALRKYPNDKCIFIFVKQQVSYVHVYQEVDLTIGNDTEGYGRLVREGALVIETGNVNHRRVHNAKCNGLVRGDRRYFGCKLVMVLSLRDNETYVYVNGTSPSYNRPIVRDGWYSL
jgi:hypothetical protein